MRFDCGATGIELAHQQALLEDKQRTQLLKWKRVFAWYPITLASHDCRWLEFVERRATNIHNHWIHGGVLEWEWEYRSIHV